MLAWSDELDAQYEKMSAEAPKSSTLAKRGPRERAAEGDGAKPAKKVKVEAGSGGVEEEVRHQWENGTLAKVRTYLPTHFLTYPHTAASILPKPANRRFLQLTLPSLKEFLVSHGRSTAGKKADLVERVEEFLEQK